jgi:hypothetical protein
MRVLLVQERFCGPPGSGNGGWTAGALAEMVAPTEVAAGAAVEVTLRLPPPLDLAMPVTLDGERWVARLEDRPVAEARVVDDTLAPVDSVPVEVAWAAESAFDGFRSHPFPGCFVCGPDRVAGDGLRIFPGPVGPQTAAATWLPGESAAGAADADRTTTPMTWAALDCVSAWAAGMADRTMVLGRMTVSVDALPHVDERHVVVGQHRATHGRKTLTAATLYDSDGRVVGRAEHTWIAI